MSVPSDGKNFKSIASQKKLEYIDSVRELLDGTGRNGGTMAFLREAGIYTVKKRN